MAADENSAPPGFQRAGRNSRDELFQVSASAGLQTAGGQIFFDYGDRRLRNAQLAYRTYSEMGDDAAAGVLLFLATNIVRALEWSIRPSGDTPDHQRWADFVEECCDDLDVPFGDFMTTAGAGMAQYGHAPYETTYKLRNGIRGEEDDETSSKFSDGLIGWQTFQLIGQDTIYRWEYNEQNKLVAVWQLAAPLNRPVRIDFSRVINFRNAPYKDSPIGRSMYRRAHRAWLRKCSLEDIECIGVERRMCGTPVVHAPPEVLSSDPNNPYMDRLESLKAIVRDFNVSDQAGILFPNEMDPVTKTPLYRLEIISGGDSAAVDITKIIDRYNMDIFRSSCADFLGLGSGTNSGGSYAMHQDKSALFILGLKAYVRNLCDMMNRVAIPRLFAMNGVPQEFCPEIDHSMIEQVDVQMICASLQNLAAAGFQTADPAVMERLFEMMGLPAPQAGQPVDVPAPGDPSIPQAAEADVPEGRPIPAAAQGDPDGTYLVAPKEQPST